MLPGVLCGLVFGLWFCDYSVSESKFLKLWIVSHQRMGCIHSRLFTASYPFNSILHCEDRDIIYAPSTLSWSLSDLAPFLVGIMLYRKGATSKWPCVEASSSSTPLFTASRFKERYDLLNMKSFGQTKTTDREPLEYLGLADENWRLIGFNRLLYVFEINEPLYRELTLELLSTFEINSAQARLRR